MDLHQCLKHLIIPILLTELPESFVTAHGLRQGDYLAGLPFNITLENSIREDGFGNRGNKSLLVLVFSDVLDITGRFQSEIKKAFVCLEAAAKKMRLTINKHKTKNMEVSSSLSNNSLYFS